MAIKEIRGEEFRRLQLLQLDMLVEFDRVCRENGINWCLGFGSMLGAVRNGGYIPWDDDADICMLREDYEKFKKVAGQLDGEVCFFQDHSTDPEYRWGYGKLRRTGTSFVRVGQEHIKCKTGVFVDVFPFDDVPRSVPGQMLQDFYCFLLRKVLWSEVGRLAEGETPFMRGVYSLLSKIPTDWVFARLGKIQRKSSNLTPNKVRILTFRGIGKLYRKDHAASDRYGIPKKWIAETEDCTFEGKTLRGMANYDDFLTFTYGDYMTPPPEDQRDPHAPVSSYEF